MLWIKAFHIFFVISWFATLLYLPRIFVNLAMETDATSTTRLLAMARKLYRFSLMLQGPAVLLGLWLWLGYGFKGGWLHAKLLLVVLAIGYNHACGAILKKFEKGVNTRSHKWFRLFNEVPAFILLGIVILVVVKPF
jgi:protoporphyrinogen IX oxidase